MFSFYLGAMALLWWSPGFFWWCCCGPSVCQSVRCVTEAPQARTSAAAGRSAMEERVAPLHSRCQCLTWAPIGSSLRARAQRAPHPRPVRLDRDRVISGYFNQSCLGGPVSNVGGPVPPRPIAAYAPGVEWGCFSCVDFFYLLYLH